MSVYYTEATPSLGNTKVKLVAAIVDPDAPDLSSEIDAVTSFDVSLTFREFNPQMTTNTGNAPRRIGTVNQLPVEGLTQYEGIEVRYPYNPQEDDTHPDNEAKSMMTRGTVLNAVVRKGPPAEDPFAAGDRVEIWEVRCGKQNFGRSGDDEFAEFEVIQMVFPVRVETQDAVVVA